jgi:type II secretory pathway predicted ATPase ExeA
MATTDPRLEAFLSRNAPDVFRSVLGSEDVWRPDRLDVPEIHAEARAAFELMLNRNEGGIDQNWASQSDRLLLVMGDAGSGKTHLMRAFRATTHERGGYFAYLQLTTGIQDYARYLLLSVLEALQRPHDVEASDESSLSYLSRSLLKDAIRHGLPGVSEQGQLEAPAQTVLGFERLAGFPDVPSDVLLALLSLQLHDPAISRRVHKFLRCEDLSPGDRALLGDVTPRTHETAPRETIEALARLARWTSGLPLVICVDQLEDSLSSGPDKAARFLAALTGLRGLTENGNVCVVIASLFDFYTGMRTSLDMPLLDRLEQGIAPITLTSAANAEQVRALLGRRLHYLFESMNVAFDETDPLYPFEPATPELLAFQRLRTIVRVAGEARALSLATGEAPRLAERLAQSAPGAQREAPIPEQVTDLGTLWNDFSLTHAPVIPEDASAIGGLLARAVDATSADIGPSRSASLRPLQDGWEFELTVRGSTETAYLAIANDKAAFGWLAKAVERIRSRSAALGLAPILVRNDEFPTNPKTQIAKLIGSLIAHGGRTVVIRGQELGVIASYFEFVERHGGDPHFDEWRRGARPLSSLPGMQALLRISGVPEPEEASEPSTPPGAPRNAPEEKPSETVAPPPRNGAAGPADPIDLGRTADGKALTVLAHDLTRHAAILGGAGSGKTTLAFRLLEELLTRGINAVLLDRKGDLAAYADPAAWERAGDELTVARRHALRERIDVRLYTPAAKDGRDLSISTLPAGLDALGASDAEQEARDAADGLGAMLEWGPARKDRLAILKQAITTLGALRPKERGGLATLIEFISSYPPELLAAIGKLDRKLLDKVVQDLETLRINEGRLLDGDAEQVDVDAMFRSPAESGAKTRLTIISTKFLGSLPTQLFWIARFLSEVGRYASRNPKPTLQGVVFLDEADMYLPATAKPATKQPLENLIRRARSAGIGILLATQSPGDLDYKSRENVTTWLVGRVSQDRAIEKLRPVFGDHGRAADELPALTVGNFYAVDERGVRRFKASLPSIIPAQLDEARLLQLAHADPLAR